MGENMGLLHRLAFDSDLPAELLPGDSLVEIMSDKRVLVEKHLGVSAYGDREVCVKIKLGSVRICGSCLELMCMTKHQLVISGKIDSVTFYRGR